MLLADIAILCCVTYADKFHMQEKLRAVENVASDACSADTHVPSALHLEAHTAGDKT